MLKKIFVTRVFVFLLLVLTVFISGSGCKEKTLCRVIEYAGWPDAIEMTNATVRVVVAPAVGRIIHYSFTGEENILWVNQRYMGKTCENGELLRENGRVIWANFGGDKVWPTEQNQFLVYNDHSWPPDVTFDGGRQSVEFLPDGVRMTTAVSPAVGARLVREIRLPGEDSRLLIVQRMEKIQTARNKENEPVPLTIWNATQIRTPQEAIFNTQATAHLPNVYFILPFFPDARNNLTECDSIGIVRPDSLKMQKIDAITDNWLAAIIDQTVFAELFIRDSTNQQTDDYLNSKVYTDSVYAQLELTSSQNKLLPGEKFEFTIAWELFSLPDSVTRPEAKRAAALNWLKDKKL